MIWLLGQQEGGFDIPDDDGFIDWPIDVMTDIHDTLKKDN